MAGDPPIGCRKRLRLVAASYAGQDSVKPVWQDQAALMKWVGGLPVWWSPVRRRSGGRGADARLRGVGGPAAGPSGLSGQQRSIERVRCAVVVCGEVRCVLERCVLELCAS